MGVQNETELEQKTLREAEGVIQAAPSLEQALAVLAELLTGRVRHFSWVGFYLVQDEQLKLGPSSGRDHPPHLPVVSFDRGPQGLAADRGETVVITNLRHQPRWLPCPATAQSEIVVPIRQDGRVRGEIDVDSRKPNGIDRADRLLLEALAEALGPLFAE